MKNSLIVFSIITILFFGTFSSTAIASVNEHANENSNRVSELIPDRYVVVLEEGFSPQEVANNHGLSPTFVYKKALNGFAGHISPMAIEKLKEDSRVKYVAQDQTVELSVQELPTGMDRIDLETNSVAKVDGIDERLDKALIAIIDTGVDLDNPDLNVDKSMAYDCSSQFFCFQGTGYADDVLKHGTHVAGIAAALDNGIGVVGVAPGATIVPVKVFSDNGQSSASAVIAGVEYVTLNAGVIDVANMSLRTDYYPPLNDAVAASIAAGVVYVVAAGNEMMDVKDVSPASVGAAITVSAIADFDGRSGSLDDQTVTFYKDAEHTMVLCTEKTDDSLACFSNFGAGVDIAAPGVHILSTIPGGYASFSGTSMAAPHVAGAAALIRSQDFGMSTDEVRSVLLSMAIPQNSPDGFTEDTDGSAESLLYVGGTYTPNQAPIANAGGDKNSDEQTSVILDGSNSYDPEKAPISFSWIQTDGPLVTLNNPNTSSPSFTTPTVYDLTALVFSLTVNDGFSNSSPDYVTVFVSNSINETPTANAGPDQLVNDSDGNGEIVTLDGSGSTDPNNDIIAWEWFENNSSLGVGVTYDYLFKKGTHTVVLEVTDSFGVKSSDTVIITVQESLPIVTITEPVSGIIDGRITVSATAENFSDLLTFWLVGVDSYALGTSGYPYQVSFHTKDYPSGNYSIIANDSNGVELASVDVTIPAKGGGSDGGSGGGPDCNAKPNHPKCS